MCCDRYALDWLYSEGIVRVLCGSHSQITCALKLHVDYPTVRTITLQSATGLPSDFNLDTIQVTVISVNCTHCFSLISFRALVQYCCCLMRAPGVVV